MTKTAKTRGNTNKQRSIIANRVRKIRGEISQEKFAEVIGVSTKLVQDMENDRRAVSKNTANTIAKKFAGRPQYLLDENEIYWTQKQIDDAEMNKRQQYEQEFRARNFYLLDTIEYVEERLPDYIADRLGYSITDVDENADLPDKRYIVRSKRDDETTEIDLDFDEVDQFVREIIDYGEYRMQRMIDKKHIQRKLEHAIEHEKSKLKTSEDS